MPITITKPTSSTPVALLRDDWQAVVTERALPNSSGDGNQTHSDSIAAPLPITFHWQGGMAPYELEVVAPRDCHTAANIPTTSTTLVNLHTGTTYTCRVIDASHDSTTATLTTLPGPRLIALPDPDHAPTNIRDLGGYRSLLGGRVRQGMLYRGAHIDAYLPSSTANATFITDTLGVKTQLDLRYPQCVEGQSCSNFGAHIRWVHAPINAYNSFTPEQSAIFRHALRTFAHPEFYPIYFHCQGGSDRTGEIAFLINGLLGVSDHDLFTDYTLSSLSLFPRPATIPYFQEWLGKIAAHAPNGAPRHQQIEAYMAAIGITPTEIATIRQIMIEA